MIPTTEITIENEIRRGVKKKYQNVARSANGFFKYPAGRAGLEFLRYDKIFYDALPEQVVESFCGVGNPFAAGEIRAGERVLDIGSGAGFDVIYAACFVGSVGCVDGIDITSAMVAKAEENIRLLRVPNAHVREGEAEALPFADRTFDVVISNGVLNLSPRKEKSFAEICRVLKPGGRLQFADIVQEEGSDERPLCGIEAWSD